MRALLLLITVMIGFTLLMVEFERWGASDAQVAWLIGVAVLLGLRAEAADLRQDASAFMRLRRELDVSQVLDALARTIADATGIPDRAIGLSCFRRQRQLRPPFRELMVRCGRHRDDGTELSSIQWTKGKGIIGRVWSDPVQDGHTFDRSKTFAAWRDKGSEAFYRASDDVRLGLSWEEFNELGDKYEIIRAFRVCDDGEVIGVVCLDVPAQYQFELSNRTVRDAVRAVMPVLKRLVA